MPRPSGQQMRMHSQHLPYDPYSYPRASYHQPYGPGYEYYRKQGMGHPPQAISPAYPSPAEVAAANDVKKKPPRPYTEYNIFFQLERERILTELEDKKKEEDGDGDEDLSSSTEKVLNQPSDENDLLPRPPQFAHLKLSPKWYDSTVRIAQNKLNKSKRKHRKTHGLVGFLDLTKMISKAWAAADPETKGYCKRLAERQLGYYKEELKAIKQQRSEQQQHLLMGQHQYPPQNMPMGYNASYGYHNRMHMAPPPPPPPSYWQQHGMSRPSVHSGPSYPEQFPRTPPSHETYIEDQRAPKSRPSSKMHPLEELMLRRKMYGSRSGSAQSKRSPTTWPSHPAQTGTSAGGESIPHPQAYVSPAESGTVTKESVTPSPPQNQDPSTPTLPVKKRLTKEGPKEHTPRSPDGGNNSSPISTSFPSPSEMMSNMFNSSPLSNSSYQRALGPYLSDSPMPYMEFSPQESIGSPMRHPASVPKHLALPTSYAASNLRAPNQRGCRSPFSDELANDILDFDEEEMDYMWNQLANSARARRNARAAAAKELFRMNHEASISSPGNTNAFGLAHSFASPNTAIPDTKVPSPGITAPPLPSIDESAEKQDSDS